MGGAMKAVLRARLADFARFTGDRRGNFALAASLVAVPLIMGLALAVDFSRIERATRSTSLVLVTAVRSALSPDGDLDADLAVELYAAGLHLPEGQLASPPTFRQLPDGAWSAETTTATRLTFGGIVLPKVFYRPVTVTVRNDPAATR